MKDRLERLLALLRRKIAIEERIFAHTAILEKAYIDANREFSVTIKGRLEDIAKLEKVCSFHLHVPR